MHTGWQDFRFGLRMLAKNPGLTTVAIITLALGIGANTGIFTILRQVVLQRLPVPHPEELVLLYGPGPKQGHVSSDESAQPGQDAGAESFSYPMYKDLRDHNAVFAGLAATANFSSTVTFRGRTERAQAELVSGNYFETLGVSAQLGRTLQPEDGAAPGSNPVVMLSDGYWKRRFGGDPSALNQGVLLNNRAMTIVGVVQPGFSGVQPGLVPDVYTPITMTPTLVPMPDALSNHKDYWVKVIGRLKPGMSRDRASAALGPLYSALLRDELPLNTGWDNAKKAEFLAKKLILRNGARGRPLLRDGAGPQLLALMSMVGLVLFIGCANVAGLLTARGAARQREMGIRFSLGASRARLVRQLSVESLLLSVTGTLLGLLIGVWTSSALVHFASENDIADGLSSTLSPAVLGFTSVLALAATVLFGAVPALRTTSIKWNCTWKEQGGALSSGFAHTRLRQTLVVCQVALTLLLVIAAGGFARSLFKVKRIDLGLRTTHVLQFSVSPQLNGYDQARSLAFFRELEDRIRILPGVLSLSGAQEPLIADSDRGSNVTVEGEPPGLAGTRHVLRNAVSPGHFSNLGIPLLKGREFTRADLASSPKVAIVNETMAKTFFPGEDAVGRRMKFGAGSDPLNMQIVGVVKDSHHSGLKEQPTPFVYIPYTQEKNVGGLTFYLHTPQEPVTLVAVVRKVVADLDPSVPIGSIRSFDEQINRQLARDWLIAGLAEIFAALAALLAAIGIYGLLAYAVTQRTREIGVRMALGARPVEVGRMILSHVARLVGIGISFGLPLAYLSGRLVGSMLYDVKPFDVSGVVMALFALVMVAAVAGYFPVRRATRVDPMVALRYE